jgi:hypothetical protein
MGSKISGAVFSVALGIDSLSRGVCSLELIRYAQHS